MAYYLLQAAYTSETWASLVKRTQNRLDVIRGTVEKLGGSLEGGWLAFGQYDVVLILQMPGNVNAAALSIAAAAGGALKSCITTPLLTFEEGLEAMKKAGKAGYQPPK